MHAWIRLLIVAGLALSQPLMAQINFTVTGTDGTAYPEISVFFTATNSQGVHYRDFLPSDFLIYENGIKRDVLRVSCPDPVTPEIALTYLLDISTSLNAHNRREIMKAASYALADQFEFPPASAGILGFDDSVYIHLDYSSNKQTVLDHIMSVTTFGGNTDVYNGFMDPVKGAIAFTKDRPAAMKYILFFTDFTGSLTFTQQNVIINAARAANIKIIVVQLTAGYYTPQFNILATRTGGSWYDDVVDTTQASQMFIDIARSTFEWPPCELVYRTDGCENDRDIKVTVSKEGRSDTETGSVNIPSAYLITLATSPSYVDYGIVPSGQKRVQTVTLTAKHGPVIISSIEASTGGFFITDMGGMTFPFTLPEGQSRTITIEYRSSGTSRTSRRLEIVADAPCQEHTKLAAGSVEENTLSVVHPNGGEQFYVGDVLSYQYTGISSTQPILIEYSIDAGSSWTLVHSNATNYSQSWQVNNTPSDSCIALMYTSAVRSTNADSAWLPSHTESFTSIDIAGNSTIMGVGLTDGSAQLYYPWDRTLTRIISAHSGSVTSVRFSVDSKWLATTGTDRYVRVWNTSDGSMVFQSTRFSGVTYSAVFSDDGQYLAGSDNQSVALWKTSDWTEVWKVSNQASANGSVAIDPRLRWVASARNNDIAILDIADGSRIKTLSGHTGTIRSIDVTEDGWYLASGGADNTIRIWNTYNWSEVRSLSGHSGTVNSVRLGIGGLDLISASDDNTVKVWNTKKGTATYSFTGHTDDVNGVAFARRIGQVFSCGDDNRIRTWIYTGSMADRSDDVWSIIARVFDINATTPQFDTLICNGEYSVQTVWLYNRGNQPLTITDLNITGTDSSAFTIVGGLSVPPEYVLAAEDSVSITIRFETVIRGSYNALLNIETDNTTLPVVSVSLTGEKLEAAYEISTTEIDFGEFQHCSPDSTIAFYITNTGNIDITIALDNNPEQPPFRLVTVFPLTLTPGQTDTAYITMIPGQEGSFEGTWHFSGIPCGYAQSITAKSILTPSAPLPVPNPLIFDYTAIGDNSSTTLTIYNRTGVTMTLTTLDAGNGPFTVQGVPPLTIAANDNMELGLTFTPNAEGPATGTLMLVSSEPCIDTVYVTLQGSSSKKPSIAVTTDTFERLVCADEMYSDVPVTIHNTGGEALVISETNIEGTNPSDFWYVPTPTLPMTIEPGNDTVLTLRFQPTSIGDRSAELIFISNAENEDTMRIMVTGRKDSVGFAVVPETASFGEQYHCTLPISETLTFTNTGNIPITISLDASVVPAWLNIAPIFPVTLDSGQHIPVSYSIETNSPGTYNASVVFSEAACGTQHAVTIDFQYADSKALATGTQHDFGTLNVSDTETFTITLTNPLQNAIVISGIPFLDGNPYLTVTEPATFPATIQPGTNLNITFQYAPQLPDTFAVTAFIISSSPCTDTIPVTLEGMSSAASATVSLPVLHADVGETIRVPITLEQSANLALAGVTAFTTDIAFNPSMLWVTGVESEFGSVQFDVTVQKPATEVHIEVTGTTAPTDGILAELVCIVALGDTDYTPLTFDAFEWVNSNATITTNNGAFTADGICRAGGNRFVAFSESIILHPNSPNPFNPRTIIGFTLPDDMHVRLTVTNTLGQEITELANGTFSAGYNTIEFNAEGYPSGVYYAVLHAANGETKTIRMLLAK